MALTKNEKIYCANNVAAEMIAILSKKLPQYNQNDWFKILASSKTYEKLYDPKTRLWAESPDYVLEIFSKETGIVIPYED